MLIRLFLVLPGLLKILVDSGYKQGVIDWAKAMFDYLLQVVKRPQRCGLKLLPKRWIVQRTFGWFLWQRRLNPHVAKTNFVNRPPQPVKRKLHSHECIIFMSGPHTGSMEAQPNSAPLP